MTTRIGLISDVHASPLPLRQALDIFERENVDDIICAGDIAGYYDSVAPTIELLARSGCKAIAGNHDQSYLEKPAREDDQDVRAYLEALPLRLELEIEGLKVLVVHASPPAEQNGGIKLLDQQGDIIEDRRQEWAGNLAEVDSDVLIVGHTHQVFALPLGHSCMILSLPELTVREFALGRQDIVRCWNFSMLFGSEQVAPSPRGPRKAN
jgi:putative phosphoesterase